jgi:hypothetical protein
VIQSLARSACQILNRVRYKPTIGLIWDLNFLKNFLKDGFFEKSDPPKGICTMDYPEEWDAGAKREVTSV